MPQHLTLALGTLRYNMTHKDTGAVPQKDDVADWNECFSELGDKVLQLCLSDEDTSDDTGDSDSLLDATYLSWIRYNATDLSTTSAQEPQQILPCGSPYAAASTTPPPVPFQISGREASKTSEAEPVELNSSDCSSTSSAPHPKKPKKPQPADGRFPVSEDGRCAHQEHWARLRGKRGHSYFVCAQCGLGWRQPTKERRMKHIMAQLQSSCKPPRPLIAEPFTVRVGNTQVYPPVCPAPGQPQTPQGQPLYLPTRQLQRQPEGMPQAALFSQQGRTA